MVARKATADVSSYAETRGRTPTRKNCGVRLEFGLLTRRSSASGDGSGRQSSRSKMPAPKATVPSALIISDVIFAEAALELVV
jgi:hypothetical protein